jgi:hypothetical protein
VDFVRLNSSNADPEHGTFVNLFLITQKMFWQHTFLQVKAILPWQYMLGAVGAVKGLVGEALRMGSMDNITALVIFLQPHTPHQGGGVNGSTSSEDD